MPNNLQNNTGLFIPLTNIWDVDRLDDINVNSPEFKELLIRLYQNINNICMATNLKDTGYYVLEEFLTGQLFFPNPLVARNEQNFRNGYRIAVDFGALPNSTSKSVIHGIDIPGDSGISFTRIYGASSNPYIDKHYIPLPYVSLTLANNIQLDVDSTYVTITTGADYSSYATTYIILEYLKD